MIRERRIAKGLKVAEIAGQLGCSQSTIYQIERSKTGGMYFCRYLKLLDFKATDITRIRAGLPNQTDIED